MKTKPALIATLLACAAAHAADIPVIPWTINVEAPHAYVIPIYRGETLILAPTFHQGSQALPLSGVYEALLRYRTTTMPEGYYSATPP
jgi:hypothetical protein